MKILIRKGTTAEQIEQLRQEAAKRYAKERERETQEHRDRAALRKALDDLPKNIGNAVSGVLSNLPAPQVTVESPEIEFKPPAIEIPAPIVNIPERKQFAEHLVTVKDRDENGRIKTVSVKGVGNAQAFD